MVNKYVPRERKEELESVHALPNNWYSMKYTDFLQERRKLMSLVIKKGYEKLTNNTYLN